MIHQYLVIKKGDWRKILRPWTFKLFWWNKCNISYLLCKWLYPLHDGASSCARWCTVDGLLLWASAICKKYALVKMISNFQYPLSKTNYFCQFFIFDYFGTLKPIFHSPYWQMQYWRKKDIMWISNFQFVERCILSTVLKRYSMSYIIDKKSI